MDKVAQLQAQVDTLSRQLGTLPDGRAAARIEAIEAELAERAETQRALYAKADAWRAVHADLRAEAAAVQKRQNEAKRGAARDLGALETHKDVTRRLQTELADLRAKQSSAALEWPIVRSAQHARKPD